MSYLSNVEIDKPYTWKQYHPGMCDHCQAACCQMPVEVTREDLLKMGLITEFDMDEPVKNLEKSLKKQKLIKYYRHKTELFMLAQTRAGDCVLLDAESRRCTVFENMPTACANFPAISSRTNFCPYLRR